MPNVVEGDGRNNSWCGIIRSLLLLPALYTYNTQRELIVSVEEPIRSSVDTLPTSSSRTNASDKHEADDEYDVVHAVDEQRFMRQTGRGSTFFLLSIRESPLILQSPLIYTPSLHNRRKGEKKDQCYYLCNQSFVFENKWLIT